MKLDIKPFEEKMKKTISVYESQLDTIRAGRANPAVLNGIMVEYYGTPTAINQMAEVKLADARTLTITPPAMPSGATDRDEMRDCEIKFDLTADNGETSITTYKGHIIGDSMIFLNDGGKYANSYVLTSPKSAYVFDVYFSKYSMFFSLMH